MWVKQEPGPAPPWLLQLANEDKPSPAAPQGPPGGSGHPGNGPDPLPRAQAYLKKCQPAISGKGGHNQTFKVACADGDLTILELQPENKRRMSAAEFINGYQPKAGQFFS